MNTFLRNSLGKTSNGVCMAATLLLLLSVALFSSCSKSKSGDSADLMKSVPSDANMVVLANVRSLLEKTDSKVGDGGDVKLSSDLDGTINSISNPNQREQVRTLLTGAAGVAHNALLFFSEGENTYATFMIDNPDSFRAYIEQTLSGKFTATGDVAVCENVAIVANQGWMRVNNTAPVDAGQILKYSKLAESQSFLSNEIASKMIESEKDIVSWFDINGALNMAGLSFSDRTVARMLLSSLFDDAAYSWNEMSFEKGKIVSKGRVLNSKGEDAKCNLPTSKINTKVVESLDAKANMVAAVAISPALVKQIEKLAASFGGGISAQYSELLKPLDGTMGVALSDAHNEGGIKMVVTINDAPVGDLSTFLNSFGTVVRDGKFLRVSSGNVAGSLDAAATAKKFSGCWLALCVDPAQLSGRTSDEFPFNELLLQLKPSDGSLSLDLELAAAGNANALVSLLKSFSVGKETIMAAE